MPSLLKAVVIAPWFAFLASAIWLVSFSSLWRYSTGTDQYVTAVFSFSILATVVGYIATVLFGLPMFLVLNRLNRLQTGYFAAAGILISLTYALTQQPINWPVVSFFSLCSITVATAFGFFVSSSTRTPVSPGSVKSDE